VIPLIFLSVSVFAESQPSKILYVGAIAIDPRQGAKALADWYSRFGIETKELILRRNIQRVFQSYFASEILKQACRPRKVKDSCPIRPKKDPDQGQFAHFHDPDGNEVTIWGGKI
jgi:predicted enzyme related to lactoylglutathione lyase